MEHQPAAGAPRLPYVRPVLRVYGTVATMTASVNKVGARKDGGPNNTKT